MEEEVKMRSRDGSPTGLFSGATAGTNRVLDCYLPFGLGGLALCAEARRGAKPSRKGEEENEEEQEEWV